MFFLKRNFISNILLILINSIMIFIFFSGCDFSLQQKDLNDVLKKINNNIEYSHQVYNSEETISTLLNKSKIKMDDILLLITTDSNLKHLKIGQHISWKTNKSGELLELIWTVSDLKKIIYKKKNKKFLKRNILKLINKTISIKKNSNFFKSAYQSGLNKVEIDNIVKAIQWQVDFHKLNIGSNFHLVFLHNLLNNKNKLLGIKLNNFGKKYYSIRAFNGNFYDINGFSKQDYFINCSFLKKYRISSKFNLHRLNPVTHRITPHLGVDLAMPQGTPVLATSNGRIIKAYFNKTAGFYIALKNKNKYVTRYMHLKKILVKLGDKIKMGQKIALSGNTGRTTGPHLHYEIWINNRAVNPISSKFLFCTKLTKKEKKVYIEESKKILKYLR